METTGISDDIALLVLPCYPTTTYLPQASVQTFLLVLNFLIRRVKIRIKILLQHTAAESREEFYLLYFENQMDF